MEDSLFVHPPFRWPLGQPPPIVRRTILFFPFLSRSSPGSCHRARFFWVLHGPSYSFGCELSPFFLPTTLCGFFFFFFFSFLFRLRHGSFPSYVWKVPSGNYVPATIPSPPPFSSFRKAFPSPKGGWDVLFFFFPPLLSAFL